MADQAADLSLGAEFPPATREQWMALVEATLKGAPLDKKLVGRTYDGLRIQPLYGRDPQARPVVGRVPSAPWQVMQRVDHPDPAAANAEALHDLENGATGLSVVFAGAVGAYGYGLDPSEATLARALEAVFLDAIAVEFDLGAQVQDAARAIATLLKRRGPSPDALQVRFGLDPLGAFAASGRAPAAWHELAPSFVTLVKGLADDGFKGPFAVADGRVVHAAGGSEAQELAVALAVALAYLRALEAGGIALEDARRMIFFRLAADADQFLTMAKFRALRKLWARIEQACGLAPEPVFLSAETAWRMMTKRDPWVNMLRTTVAAFAAGLGGADAVTVLPFTAALGLPDRFARRIARNAQLILQQESHLAKVADPAVGSGGVEDLTRKLCEAAWSLLQEIEAAGDAVAALEQGLVQQKVAAVRKEREAAVARRKDALTGTSEFPNIFEAPVSVLAVTPVALAASGPDTVSIPPLSPFRLAEPFEALRDASDRVLAQTGARPNVFLANLGPLSAFTARAMFARNLFEAGGIEAVTNDGFLPSLFQQAALSVSPLPGGERSTPKASGEGEQSSRQRSNPSPGPSPSAPDRPLPMGEVRTDLAALVAAFKAAGARLACLCSSDNVYAREAVEAAKALAAAGAKHIYLAGRPGALEGALKAAGVQSFIYVGCDVLATLKAAHDILGQGR